MGTEDTVLLACLREERLDEDIQHECTKSYSFCWESVWKDHIGDLGTD